MRGGGGLMSVSERILMGAPRGEANLFGVTVSERRLRPCLRADARVSVSERGPTLHDSHH